VRKSLTLWLCVLIVGATVATVAAVQQTADAADRTGIWSGTWEGAGATGGFELTLEKPKDGPLAGRLSVTGEPTYKVTFRTVAIDGNKLTATYDFPAAEGAEVVLAGTFEGNVCKGTWVLREKASGNAAVDGTWSVTKK
jgi:hypothetical protein